jgi:hypothetical protein
MMTNPFPIRLPVFLPVLRCIIGRRSVRINVPTQSMGTRGMVIES